MQNFSNEPPIEPQEQPTGKKKPVEKLDSAKIQACLFEIYETQAWLVNQVNMINTYINSLRVPQQQQPFYQEPDPPYVPPSNSSEPTFTKRPAAELKKSTEPEKPAKKPWYQQKGIIAGIILGLLALYLVYIMIMRAQGHTITIPGLGKF
jgi:hypothetical protein